MEVVGTVAAVIALAKDIAAISDSLVRDIRHAPQELIQCCNQIALISLELMYIERLQKPDMLRSLLPTDEVRLLLQAMQIAKNDITAIQDKLSSYKNRTKTKSSVSSRLSWALFDRKSAEGTLDQMQRIESRMALLLGLFNMHIGIDSRNQNAALNLQILSELQSQKEMTSTRVPPHSSLDTLVKNQGVDSTIVFRHRYSFNLPESWKKYSGAEIELISSANGYQSAHAFKARLPFLLSFGKIDFVVSLSFRRALGYWPNFSLLGGGLHFVNVIPTDSQIVQACKIGDVVAVRKLFNEAKASPNDMTTDNSLIYYAIESGSMQLVRYLIDVGAPVQSKQLILASWKRQPNTARLLLSTKSADVESLSLNGYTVASFLYGCARPRIQQAEFLEILASHSFSQFNTQDKLGWTVLHRAAAWGTADDIEVLSRMNVIQNLRTLRLSWTPLICAVAYKNFDAMRKLCEMRGESELQEEQDIRGWNLLHIAIAYGNLDAVPYLLQKKVSLETLSTATSCYVPPLLKDKEIRPNEMARSFGKSAYRRWTEQLLSVGLAVDVQPEDIDWTLEGPDQAFGECECCDNWIC